MRTELTALDRLRGGAWPVVLYGLLGILSFPTFGHVLAGEHGLAYALDVFEVPLTRVGQVWLDNGLTFWNPDLSAGNAVFAQQWYSPFSLDAALALVIGAFGAYLVTAYALAVVAGLSMHLFLRDSLQLPTVAVLAGGIIYTLAFWDFAYGFAAPAFPLLLWLIDRAVANGPNRWRYVIGGSLLGAIVLYHGLSQVVLLGAAVQLAYSLSAAADRRQAFVSLRVWAAQWILALGLYGPVLLTQFVMLPISNRTIWDLPALADPSLITNVIDTALGYSQTIVGVPIAAGVGASPGAVGTFFVGAIGLPILVIGLLGRRREPRGRFMAILLIVIPLWSLAVVIATPLEQQFGFLRSFQLDRLAHLLPFALVANVAIGIGLIADHLLARRPLELRRWAWFAVAASFVPLVVATVVAVVEIVRRRRDLLDRDATAIGWLLLGTALIIGLICVAILILAVRRPDRSVSPRGAVIILAVLLLGLAGERAMFAWGERLTADPATLGTWAQTLGATPAKAFLQDQPGVDVDRVLSFGGRPNQIASAGMLQVDGYQSMYPLTYHQFFGALIAPELAGSPFLRTYYGSWGNRAVTFGPNVDPELVALSGARWLYVLGNDVPTVPGIVARFQDATATVYEVPDVLPRAFIAGGLDVRRDPADVVAGLSAADLATLRGTAFVASGGDADQLWARIPADAASGSAGSTTIASYTPDRVVVRVNADRPGILVLTDVMAPGWVAERDGREVPIATVDATFRGVSVDETTRQVVFRYVPTFTFAGLAIAALALVAAISWALVVRRHDRHERSAEQA